jgi:hypothetical protein
MSEPSRFLFHDEASSTQACKATDVLVCAVRCHVRHDYRFPWHTTCALALTPWIIGEQ